ncbi:MAG: hypothetical protein AB8B89_08405 [Gammaproteobacteria bacterium]
MDSVEREGFKNEWSVLQNQSDSYEKYSLIIKLINIGLVGVAYITGSMGIFVLCMLLVLWMQDAIWKTYQSRIEYRLLQIEGYLLSDVNEKAYQLNSDYQKNRPGSIALIGEYLRQAIRPTVAFPHAVLVFIFALFL